MGSQKLGTGELGSTRWFLPGLLAFGLLVLVLILLSFGQVQDAAAGESTSSEPSVLRADATGVTLEWCAPAASLRQVIGDDGRSYVALDAPGWAQTDVAGQPQLLLASALVVVPPTGDVTFQVQVLESERLVLPRPVVPAPAWMPVGAPPAGVEPVWARDERAYAESGLPWAKVVTLEEAGWMRGRRLVRLTFSPMRFEFTQSEGPALEVARRVRVDLSFEDTSTETSGWADNDLYTPILQHTVINPAQATQFARPARVASAPLAHTLAATSAPSDTQYLIIAHSNFIDAVAPLAAHRAISDGLRIFSTTVEAIGGSSDPIAIRDYISATYHSPATPILEYVLLVGDGVETGSEGQYIPPYTIMMTAGEPSWWQPEWGSQVAASDNRFVTVDGSDNLPDISIGRLPVNSVPETEIVVDKILDYDLDPPQYPWNERVLFFAGNEDTGESFHADANAIYNNHLPDTLTGRRVYFCTGSCSQPYEYDDITTVQDVTMATLNGGGLLASYVGHSSWHQWAWDPQTYAPMFHLNDVSSLHNGGALPVFLEMTCYTSRFSDPDGATLDESLLRHEGGGAVATWGSTTLGRTLGHNIMHQKFFDVVFNDAITTTRIGPAADAAKLYLYDHNSTDRDLIDTFILLGDPAMDLNLTVVPWTDKLFLPLVMRGG